MSSGLSNGNITLIEINWRALFSSVIVLRAQVIQVTNSNFSNWNANSLSFVTLDRSIEPVGHPGPCQKPNLLQGLNGHNSLEKVPPREMHSRVSEHASTKCTIIWVEPPRSCIIHTILWKCRPLCRANNRWGMLSGGDSWIVRVPANGGEVEAWEVSPHPLISSSSW